MAQSSSKSDPAQQQQVTKTEFVIRVANKTDDKRWSVLKFNQADNVDPGKWNKTNEVYMEREDNRSVMMSTQSVQEFGEGSEFGKAAREEARRKKYGRQARTYAMDHQPWHLNFVDNNGKERKMNSIREGDGHADYWIFMKQGDEFVATKVDEMHRFTNAIKYKTLDADAAEEAFLKRDKVMNHFVQKAEIRNKIAAEDDGEKVSTKPGLKIKDMLSSDDSGNEREEDGEKEKQKKKKQKSQMKRKDKRQRVDNPDDIAKYESSDGEDEGREQDYMTDSGSDSEREGINVDEKMDKELVGVGDESGLKKMIDSDESESESDEDFMRKILEGDGTKKSGLDDIEDRDSSGSDTDDPDKEKIESHVFMPINPKKEYVSSAGSSETAKKRPAGPDEEGLNPAKKIKIDNSEGLNEETVRKYLRRKPHTTKELLSKIKGRCGDLPKSEIVTRLANILKTIEPQQFKQKQGKKEVLFFSLGNQMPR